MFRIKILSLAAIGCFSLSIALSGLDYLIWGTSTKVETNVPRIEEYGPCERSEKVFYPEVEKSDYVQNIEDHFNFTFDRIEYEIENPEIEEPEPEEPELIIDETYIRAKYPKAIKYIAQCLWGECRGSVKMHQAAVVWTILNRVDSFNGEGEGAIIGTITAKYQFTGWHDWNPVWESLEGMAIDVLIRWEMEKAGFEDVGRVLPKGYCWFRGYGGVNHFRSAYKNGKEWDWSLPNPYI